MDRTDLAAVPLLAGARRRQLTALARLLDEVDVDAGRTLTRQGSLASEFFLIRSGTAVVVRDGRPVARLGQGDHFGEIGLLAGPSRSATVVAETPMRLAVASARDFEALRALLPRARAELAGTAALRSARDRRPA